MGLAEFEADIRAAFEFHQQRRKGLPVFGLEHGLDLDRVRELRGELSHQVRLRSVEPVFKAYPFSVVAVSSEVGYDYRGTGTDFWPKFEAAIAATITDSGRQAHTQAFRYAHKAIGLKAPEKTPWTRNFRHIAWPITNAIASREIHRPLALALRNAMTFAFGGAPVSEIVDRLQIEARSQQNTRLIEWLRHTDVASALVSRLLDLPLDDGAVEIVSLDRIVAELQADPIARSSVESASSRLRITAHRRPIQFFRFRFRIGEHPLVRVALQVPCIEGPEREAIEGDLARIGGRVALAGGAFELASSNLLTGSELDIEMSTLRSLLSGNAELLVDRRAPQELSHRLGKLMPTVSDPMVLVEEMTPGCFVAWSAGRGVPRGRRVLLATTRPTLEVEGLEPIADVEGVHFQEIQLSSGVGLSHLAKLGFALEHAQPCEIVGGIRIAEGVLGPIFARGMPVILRRAERADPGEWVVRSDAAGRLNLSSDDVAATLPDGPDHQEIRVESGGSSTALRIDFTSDDETSRPLSIRLEPSSPSVEDIQRGQLRLQISSPVELNDVLVSINVEASGVMLASSSTTIASLPATIGSGSDLIRELAKALVEAAPSRAESLYLEVSLHRIWKRRWRLEWDPVEVAWLEVDGAWHALSGDGELEVYAFEAGTPLAKTDYDPSRGREAKYRVLLPGAHGAPVYLGAICDGPATLKPGDIDPRFDANPTRTLESSAGSLGFLEVLNGYLLWSVARPAHPLAQLASRTVARRIEELMVEQMCGRVWLDAERRTRLSAGSLYDVLAGQAIDANLAVNGDLPCVPASLQMPLARNLAVAMQSAWPQLSANPQGVDFEKFAEHMDAAVAATYEGLADLVDDDEAEAFSDVDPYSEPSSWQSALENALDRASGTLLSRMILPTDRGRQLQRWDYQLPEAQLIALLSETHTDLSLRGQQPWITTSGIQDCLHLWIEPSQLLRNGDWKTSILRFLQDRQTARAVRYAALRFRAARSMVSSNG